LRAPDRKKMLTATAIMVFAIALATLNIFPAAVSFSLGVLLVMLTRVMPLRNIYQAVDWPVIVLLGALLPVAQAMETTGAAEMVATVVLQVMAQGNAVVALVLILVVTMLMTDVINNAATAAVMSPIAIGAASQLDANADPFLMAVAVGASCAFLTPIGHQNNTLILGPGGFRFGDYWPLGLPLEALVISIAVPVLLLAWPL
ncbi:MAG TPA: SLC13 family permease, partial [Burkholderiaceae bacterium]|nr:SLC13 family permease [Burkholderiaceae bacterium]